MPVDLTIPEWLQKKCTLWIERLGMQEWNVTLRLELCPLDDPTVQASTSQVPALNLGRIAFRADVEDSEWWEIVLVHELLHIKQSRVDSVVTDVIIPTCSDPAMAQAVYANVVEPYIHSLAEVLVKAYATPIKPASEGRGRLAGEDLRAGDFVYVDEASGLLKKALPRPAKATIKGTGQPVTITFTGQRCPHCREKIS